MLNKEVLDFGKFLPKLKISYNSGMEVKIDSGGKSEDIDRKYIHI